MEVVVDRKVCERVENYFKIYTISKKKDLRCYMEVTSNEDYKLQRRQAEE